MPSKQPVEGEGACLLSNLPRCHRYLQAGRQRALVTTLGSQLDDPLQATISRSHQASGNRRHGQISTLTLGGDRAVILLSEVLP